MLAKIHQILNSYNPISLAEMDSVKLMDRTDTKFTFHINQLPEVLELAKSYYKVFEINNKRISDYKTLYYDTSDLELYNIHHTGKLNRYKVRHRTYVDSNIAFLEVKYKTNKGKTFKSRIKELEVQNSWNSESTQFLLKKTPYIPSTLIPALWVNYSRITLVSVESKERLTLDLNLEFKKGDKEQKLHQLIIAEVKQEKAKGSPFINIMKQLHIREGSISKYCMAMAYTEPSIKTNRFKAKLLSIKKILDYDTITN